MSPFADALSALATRVGVRASSTVVDGTGRAAQRAAGEHAAGNALAQAGSVDVTLRGRATDGCPLFPPGYAGSIAHTKTVAVAAAVEVSPATAAIGIDVEASSALPAADAVVVLDDAEQALVEAHERPDWCATVLWSAKEAAFKAWSAAAGDLGRVDPVDISVRIDEATTTVEVVANGGLAGTVGRVGPAVGAYAEAGGCIVTLVRVAAASEAG